MAKYIDRAVINYYGFVFLHLQLLAVRRRLQHLSGLPVCAVAPTKDTLSHLYTHILNHCLPFLRLAAFAIHQITDVDVPAGLKRPPEERTTSTLA